LIVCIRFSVLFHDILKYVAGLVALDAVNVSVEFEAIRDCRVVCRLAEQIYQVWYSTTLQLVLDGGVPMIQRSERSWYI